MRPHLPALLFTTLPSTLATTSPETITLCGKSHITPLNASSDIAHEPHDVPLLAFGACVRAEDNSFNEKALGKGSVSVVNVVDSISVEDGRCGCSVFASKDDCEKGSWGEKGFVVQGVGVKDLTGEMRWVSCFVGGTVVANGGGRDMMRGSWSSWLLVVFFLVSGYVT
ncbi:hypothetical protein DM02DRAFT_675140 [Periconia macrospinosa]|uniref:Uncharacterized protein n=1 Tax=Periconia macrospinosa TaxID=97972 RepID=A0A2V1DEC2_9PLEO|nr:hypothetical protein DM02DRAFT_675140 [Periconia macrospinosa]